MMFYTHLAFGLFLGLISSEFLNVQSFLFLSGVLVGSIFVDIDNFNSKIGRNTLGISFLFQTILGHRGIFHTFLFAFLISFVLFFLEQSFGLGFFVGYVSHLIMDSLNVGGIKWIYPFSEIRIKGMIKVNGFYEKLIFFLFVSLDIIYFLNYIL